MTGTQSALDEFEDAEASDVYVTTTVSSSRAKYHTDPDCAHLTDAHEPISLEDVKEQGLEECRTCRGNPIPPGLEACGVETKTGDPCQVPALKGIGRCPHHFDFTSAEESAADSSTGHEDHPVWERQRDELTGGR